MERLDAFVGGLGIVVVAAALVGAAASGPAAALSFHIAFPEERSALPDASGSVAGDGAKDLPFRVDVLNLTRVEARVEVVGQGPRVAPDDVTATLKAPDGRTVQARGSIAGPGTGGESAALDLSFPFAPAPAARDVLAPSEAAALAQVSGLATHNGTGTWTLTVAVRSQQGLGAAHAEAHAITARIAAFAARAVVQPLPSR